MTIGVLGCGNLAEYLIEGAGGGDFLLGPRGRSADIAARFGCRVAASNQAVVDAVDHLLVCLPAATGLGVLGDLRFRPGQSVCSAMAGARLPDLRAAVAPAGAVAAMMPGFANAYAMGPSVLCPPDAFWQGFLARLGPVHVFDDPAAFETAWVFGGMSGATVFLMRHLADWFVARGLAPDQARALVAETFRGNAEVLLRSEKPLEEITAGVTTPGGITEQIVRHLRDTGALAGWHQALDAVRDRMAPPD